MATSADYTAFLSPLRLTVERDLLKYAVGRAMFCACGVVLDCRRAVLIDGSIGDAAQVTAFDVPATRTASAVACIACADAGVARLRAAGWYVETTDGRVLFPPPAPRKKPDRSTPRPHGVPHAHKLGRCRACRVVWHGPHVRVGMTCPTCNRKLARTTCDASATYRPLLRTVGGSEIRSKLEG